MSAAAVPVVVARGRAWIAAPDLAALLRLDEATVLRLHDAVLAERAPEPLMLDIAGARLLDREDVVAVVGRSCRRETWPRGDRVLRALDAQTEASTRPAPRPRRERPAWLRVIRGGA